MSIMTLTKRECELLLKITTNALLYAKDDDWRRNLLDLIARLSQYHATAAFDPNNVVITKKQ